MNLRNFKPTLKLILLVAIIGLGLGVNYIFADWVGPPGNPPSGDIFPPVNTGGNFQEKLGGLFVGTGNVVDGFGVGKGTIRFPGATNLPNNNFTWFNHTSGVNFIRGTTILADTDVNNKIGIGMDPAGSSAKLLVNGKIGIRDGSEENGLVLTSDANGLATWKPAAGGLPGGISGQTLRHSGSAWEASNVITNNGVNVGINQINPTQQLHVSGNLRLNGHIFDVNDTSGQNNQVLTRTANGVAWQNGAGGGGTVTSVGLAMPSQFTVTGSPVTGSGTLTGIWKDQIANSVFAGPTNGQTQKPTFRSLVRADIPDLDASDTTSGTFAVARGGTGASSFTAGRILFGNGASPINTSANLFWNNTASGVLELNGNSKIKITGGSPAVGEVLTATDSLGNSEWRNPAPQNLSIVYDQCDEIRQVSDEGTYKQNLASDYPNGYTQNFGGQGGKWMCGSDKVLRDISSNGSNLGGQDYYLCCRQRIVAQ